MIFLRAKDIAEIGLHVTTLTRKSIERVSDYTYFGIWLDQKLTFKFHINTLVSKLKQKIGYTETELLSPCSVENGSEAVFLSVLDYGGVL